MDADRAVASVQSANRNVAAFLHCIRVCEGTDAHDGYAALFGYTPTNHRVFPSFADHPRIKTKFMQTDGTVNYTSAAGAYQFIISTWDRVKAKLHLPDFGPDSQDRAAMELIAEAGAMPAVKAGRFQEAIDKCSGVWASLPASHYPQPKRTIAYALNAYTSAGGMLA